MDKEKRRSYLGGTDAAAVLGLSRWTTGLQVWSVKTGQIIPEDVDSEAALLGKELEDYVARRFSKITGKKVQRVNETLYHPEYKFLGANIDRRVVGENAVLECKTATMWKYREWKDEDIPQEYLIQVLHYMAVGGFTKGYIACLIGNHKFVWKEISYDKKVLDDLINKEVRFWNDFVVTGRMPMTVSSNDSDVLYQLFPKGNDKEIELTDSADRILENIDSMQADLKSLEAQIEQQKNEIKLILKDNNIGKSKNFKVTWRDQSFKRLDVNSIKEEIPEIYNRYSKETKTRVLKIFDLKGESDETGRNK